MIDNLDEAPMEKAQKKFAQAALPRKRRNAAAIKNAMLQAAGADPQKPLLRDGSLVHFPCENIGLTLRRLEDERWRVSPSVARAKLFDVGLPYEGRRAGLIYSWSSIFRAEGLDTEHVKNVTRETHPHLFQDLLDAAHAAVALGFRDTSSIRKLVSAGRFAETDIVRFGARGVYRFRPMAIHSLQKQTLAGRIV